MSKHRRFAKWEMHPDEISQPIRCKKCNINA